MLNRMTPVVKNLVIINVLVFLAQGAMPGLEPIFIGHYPLGMNFQPWQVVTHMFMHGGLSHIFFNMFALVVFGSALERAWGSKRFLQYYLLCGIGAFLLFEATVVDRKIDMQTYIKVILSLYYDMQVSMSSKAHANLMALLKLLFRQDAQS